jgi:hypothetical protein
MRVTIIKDDNMVYVDGLALPVDCSSLPARFHALQWYEDHGEIERVDARGHHIENEPITDLAPFQSCLERWTKAKALRDGADAAAKAAAVPVKTTAKGGVNVIA